VTITEAADLQEILRSARVIAVVGHSDRPERTSYQIADMLRREGFVVYPVNPTISHIDGKTCYPDLASVPEPIDIVDVFRRSEFLDGVVDDAIAVGAKTVWTQLGVIDEDAARKAEAAGLNMVMNRCIKIEYYRFFGR
jgi:predicted CoA-binding protein